jgi:hypothetical protein
MENNQELTCRQYKWCKNAAFDFTHMKNQMLHFWPMQKWKHPKQRCMVCISFMQQGRSYAKRREWKTTNT